MFNLTVEDASKRLGVGRARVNQLIRSGMLAAEKVGGIWLIDEQSVEARRNAAPKAGRPSASSGNGTAERYVPMSSTLPCSGGGGADELSAILSGNPPACRASGLYLLRRPGAHRPHREDAVMS